MMGAELSEDVKKRITWSTDRGERPSRVADTSTVYGELSGHLEPFRGSTFI